MRTAQGPEISPSDLLLVSGRVQRLRAADADVLPAVCPDALPVQRAPTLAVALLGDVLEGLQGVAPAVGLLAVASWDGGGPIASGGLELSGREL